MSKYLKKNVPVLRFPEFKGDLELKYLGEILDFKNGINADKSQYGQGVKFINVLDIINDAPIYYDSIIGCVDISDQEFQKNNVQYGDVLFQRSSEIREESGQSNIYLDKNQDATFGGFVIRGRPKVKFNPIYFNYLLKTGSVRKEVTDRSGGSTRFNIGQDSLSQVPILICNSIAEQEKIASFLGAVDTRLTQLRRKHELLQTYKRGVMQKVFCRKLGKKKHKKKPELRLEKFIGDWKPVLVGSFIEAQNTIGLEDIPLYSLTIENGITEKTERYERQFLVKNEDEAYKLVRPNDFAYNPMNLRFGAIARHKKHISVKVSKYYDVFSIRSNVNLTFAEYLLTNEDSIQYYDSLASGSLIEKKRLHFSEFKKISFLIPSLEEQETIANFLTAIDQKIEAVAKQIELTEQFKKGLLQKMFV